MGDSKLDLLQGTLDLMVLQTLNTLGPLHGYGIARRIEQVSGNEVLLNQGTIYAPSSLSGSAAGSPPNGAPPTTIARPSFIPSPSAVANSSPQTRPTGKGSRS